MIIHFRYYCSHLNYRNHICPYTSMKSLCFLILVAKGNIFILLINLIFDFKSVDRRNKAVQLD